MSKKILIAVSLLAVLAGAKLELMALKSSKIQGCVSGVWLAFTSQYGEPPAELKADLSVKIEAVCEAMIK